LPADDVQIKSLRLSNLGLGNRIYTKKQLEKFAKKVKEPRGHTWHSWQNWPTMGGRSTGSGDLPWAIKLNPQWLT
jgi:hypothetical protein